MSEEKQNTTGEMRSLGAWEFDNAVADGTVLLEFYADRCTHCRAMEPVLAEFAGKHPEMTVYRVDTDREVALAVRMDVRRIPTLVLYRDGKEIDRRVGGMPLPEMETFVAEVPVAGMPVTGR